jgi:2-polyprenyl-3-methyl-5-hydroxy-6-metoxy-1,4-benzoquinol methylase
MISEKSLNYIYPIDPESDTAGANVLRLVGNNKKVLEIGAGPGSVLKVLQEINHCDMTAIEIYPKYVEKLKEICQKVIVADLNDTNWNKVIDENQKFDVVLAADVLEHINDPLLCLKNMTELLNKNGEIVISLPHIGHAVIAGCLWEGDFEYREWGLLDKTHIRFFGIKNVEKLIDDAQLKIIDVRFVIRSPDQTEFYERWSQLPRVLKINLLKSPYACIYQIVLKVVPKQSQGIALNLTKVPIPKARNIPLGIFNESYTSSSWIRNIIRKKLSLEVKIKLKSLLNKWGINV